MYTHTYTERERDTYTTVTKKNQVIYEEQFSVKLIGFHDVTLGIMFTTDRWQKLIEANLESSTVWISILMSDWKKERKRENMCMDVLTIKNEERRRKSNTAQKYTKENSSRENNSK